ncbi:hypothetical protein pb186bvf_017835 [Paramecium bursaria]
MKRIAILIEYGFNEQVAQKTVKKYPFTNNLEELINKALEMSDTSKKFTEQKISLIQFSDSDDNPLDDQIFQDKCQICFNQQDSWIHFVCGHKFCKACILENIKTNKIESQTKLHCLQVGCESAIQEGQDLIYFPTHIPQQLCLRCKLPQAAHKFSWFSNPCENAEFDVLNTLIKQDAQGNVVQRCPSCGIWVQKLNGCNSVKCTQKSSYCSSEWCWLCRRTITTNHFREFNALGCPGLGAEINTIEMWPWHKICWKRVKAVIYYFLLTLLCFLVFPFFVAFLIIKRQQYNFDVPLYLLIPKVIGIAILFLILSVLVIIPGIPIMILSQRARLYIFAQ